MASPEAISNYEVVTDFLRVARGEADCHVWRSRTHPSILINRVMVEPGVELSEEDKGWNGDGLHDAYQPYYDGLMPTEEAMKRHEDYIAACSLAEDDG